VKPFQVLGLTKRRFWRNFALAFHVHGNKMTKKDNGMLTFSGAVTCEDLSTIDGLLCLIFGKANHGCMMGRLSRGFHIITHEGGFVTLCVALQEQHGSTNHWDSQRYAGNQHIGAVREFDNALIARGVQGGLRGAIFDLFERVQLVNTIQLN